jgi:predicted alpha-1,2-mannosidase
MNGWTLWNPETKFFWGKDAKGNFVNGYFGRDDKWIEGFDPSYRPHTWHPPFYEGSVWGYAFYMQHDIKGLIERHGGNEEFMAFLDLYFDDPTAKNKLRGNHDSGNEPSFLNPWLYTFVGRPDKNVDRIRHIFSTDFKATRDGLPGNDDGGAMSTQYVFAAMGFFPVAGQDYYLMASPFFSKVTMQLGDGKMFVISAMNLSQENIYIQSATLNGKSWNKGWFQHKDIINGAELILEMGSKPSDWGTKASPPPSALDNL